jgi:hypothetical protein
MAKSTHQLKSPTEIMLPLRFINGSQCLVGLRRSRKQRITDPHSGFHGRATATGAPQSMNIDDLMKDPLPLAFNKEPKQWVHTTEHESVI